MSCAVSGCGCGCGLWTQGMGGAGSRFSVLGSRFYVLYLGPARGKKKIVDEGPINGQQPTKMKGEAKVSGVAAHLHHKNYT